MRRSQHAGQLGIARLLLQRVPDLLQGLVDHRQVAVDTRPRLRGKRVAPFGQGREQLVRGPGVAPAPRRGDRRALGPPEPPWPFPSRVPRKATRPRAGPPPWPPRPALRPRPAPASTTAVPWGGRSPRSRPLPLRLPVRSPARGPVAAFSRAASPAPWPGSPAAALLLCGTRRRKPGVPRPRAARARAAHCPRGRPVGPALRHTSSVEPLAQQLARPVQLRFRRAFRHARHVGDLFVLVALHVVEDEHRTGPGRQGGRERAPGPRPLPGPEGTPAARRRPSRPWPSRGSSDAAATGAPRAPR